MNRRRLLPAIILVGGLLITVLSAWTVNAFLVRAENADAALEADHATASVRLGLDRAAIATRAVRAMYAADVVTTEQFTRFAQTLATSRSVSALGFIRRVDDSDRVAYEATLTTEPAKTLGIWENGPDGRPVRAGDRPAYYVVESAFVPGAGGSNPIGLDSGSLDDRADVIRRALDRFQLAITGEVNLVAVGGRGIVLFDPVVDRQSRLIGVATASVTHADLVRTAAQTSGVSDFAIEVGGPGTAPAPAPDTAATTSADANGGAAAANTSRIFAFADRLVTVTVNGTRAPGVRPWIDLLVIALGLAATAAAIASLFNSAKSRELRVAEGNLRSMLDGLGPIALLLAPDGRIINANRAATTTFARSEEEMRDRPFEGLFGAADEDERTRLQSGVEGATRGEDVRFDLKLDSTDGRQVFDLWIRRKELGGDLVASAVDVTDRYEAEETQRLLMRELDHRMKNTLQVIQAIIRRTATSQESIQKFEQALLGRVGAMSRAHDLLANERWHGADITAVVRQETEHLSGGRAITAQGPHFRLSPKAALSLALVIHELGTNAVKYGALSVADGKVAINWEIDRTSQEPRLVLRWQESQGPRVVPPKRRGFGSLLIERSIAYELDGTADVSYREEGLICIIAAPLRTVRSFAQPNQSMLAG